MRRCRPFFILQKKKNLRLWGGGGKSSGVLEKKIGVWLTEKKSERGEPGRAENPKKSDAYVSQKEETLSEGEKSF